MGFSEEVDQGGKDSTKAEFKVVTLKISWEGKQSPLQKRHV